MALKKAIRQRDGVTTEYHRIMFLTITTNRQNSIAVFSYVDEEARGSDCGEYAPYRSSITYETDYDPEMTVEDAYEYLKALPEFADAADC